MSRYPYPVFGWRPHRLADLSLSQLNDLREAVINDKANAAPSSELFLYTPTARRKLDALSWAVYSKLKEYRTA